MSIKSILLTNSIGLLFLLLLLFGYQVKGGPSSVVAEYLQVQATDLEEMIHSYSTEQLEKMYVAAKEISKWRMLLHQTQSNILTEILKGEKDFSPKVHYPKGEVSDMQYHSQYYYHMHRPGEHGHFHFFLHTGGIPKECFPLFIDSDRGEKEGYTHLFAVSVDEFGNPLQFFTVNQWVTGGDWYQAEDIKKMVNNFYIGHTQPSWILNRWINAILTLFHPQITLLIEKRDEVLQEWKEKYPTENPLEDLRLEIITAIPISTKSQFDRITKVLDGR